MAHSHIIAGADANSVLPGIRTIRPMDLKDALAKGIDDFYSMPTHAVFLCLIYPILGLILFRLAVGYDVLPLLFPLAAGFALIGPFTAVGLYELSRRRELGLDTYWTHAFDVFHSPSIGAITALGVLLMVIFLLWLAVAQAIYVENFGYAPAASVQDFVEKVFTTSAGWKLIIAGNAVGFLFAVLVLTISVVSFPLLLDRNIGVAVAVLTSVRAVAMNPVTMALWGLMVIALLAIGSLIFLLGLTVVLPVLGHSTWHLYRKAVEPDGEPRLEYRRGPKRRRYAADFPAVLFPWSGEDRP